MSHFIIVYLNPLVYLFRTLNVELKLKIKVEQIKVLTPLFYTRVYSQRSQIFGHSIDFIKQISKTSQYYQRSKLLLLSISAGKMITPAADSQENFYKIIAEFSNDWACWINPDNKYEFISPSCRLITGYSSEEFFNDPDLLSKIIHPEDKDVYSKHCTDGVHKESFNSFNFRIINRAGKTRWIAHVCQAVYNNEGKYIGRYVSNRDITEQKKVFKEGSVKDRLLYQVFEQSELGMFHIAPDENVTLINPALIRMLGRDDLDAIDWENEPATNIETRQKILGILNTKGKISGLEVEWVKPNGKMTYLRVTVSLIKDKSNSEPYYDGIVEDITEKVLFEKAAFKAIIDSQKVEKLKTEFLSRLSHEIRTPLFALISSANLIREEISDYLNDDLKQQFTIMELESKRILRTMQLSLDMSQLKTGTFEIKPEHIDLYSEILVKVFHELEDDAAAKGLGFDLKKESESNIIFADKYSTLQIFTHLVENAIKYTNRGSIQVVIYRNNENKLSIDVKDTGVGIDGKYLPYLFEAFSQEENDYSRKFEGNGLGLALVKKFCEFNNAEINVQSEKGSGSIFAVTFLNS